MTLEELTAADQAAERILANPHQHIGHEAPEFSDINALLDDGFDVAIAYLSLKAELAALRDPQPKVPDKPGWWWLHEHKTNLQIAKVFEWHGILKYRVGHSPSKKVEDAVGQWLGQILEPKVIANG